MVNKKQRLILEQVSRNLATFQQGAYTPFPSEGWVRTIRKAINMSLAQLARRLQKKPPTVNDFEKREQAGTITLQSLREIAEAMDMKLVYAIVPKSGTLDEMVNEKVALKAQEIVNRTSTTMALEDQENTKARLLDAFAEKKIELKNEMPKFLWD
ncbi:MAG: mobile mystery protein A [Ferruginibacter sp.]|nr:mobile mystery protein A [Chitinophagaceae bacterium]